MILPFIQEPVNGTPQANVVLRPVNLLKLEQLLRAGSATRRLRVVFGTHTGSIVHQPACFYPVQHLISSTNDGTPTLDLNYFASRLM